MDICIYKILFLFNVFSGFYTPTLYHFLFHSIYSLSVCLHLSIYWFCSLSYKLVFLFLVFQRDTFPVNVLSASIEILPTGLSSEDHYISTFPFAFINPNTQSIFSLFSLTKEFVSPSKSCWHYVVTLFSFYFAHSNLRTGFSFHRFLPVYISALGHVF